MAHVRIDSFNPRAPHGARRRQRERAFGQHIVSIHAPRTGRDDWLALLTIRTLSFNPRAPHGARQQVLDQISYILTVSIHAPRTGRDPTRMPVAEVWGPVSIHAPRTGRDSSSNPCAAPPSRFNPRAPHGARPRLRADDV